MYKALYFVLLSLFVQSSNAAIMWTWDFENPNINVAVNETIPLNIRVTNDSSSDSPLYLHDFFLFDGSWGDWGLVRNDESEVIYTPTVYGHPSEAIEPGGSVEYLAGMLYPSGLLGSGESTTINPFYYVRDNPDEAVGFLPPQYATNPLSINVSPVPLPPAAWLFLTALFFIAYAVNNNRGCKYQDSKKLPSALRC